MRSRKNAQGQASTPAPSSNHAAGQIAAVLSATIHISPIWRQCITDAMMKDIVDRWAGIISSESDDEKVIVRIINDLASVSGDFHIAWLHLTTSQQLSCGNAMRNIIFEWRATELRPTSSV